MTDLGVSQLFGVQDKVAIVTGGSRGIGRMIVEGFLANGAARVYISARKAGSQSVMLKVVDYLVAKERAAMAAGGAR